MEKDHSDEVTRLFEEYHERVYRIIFRLTGNRADAEELTQEHYRSLGEKLIANYYNRHAPFDSDITIGTEMSLNFTLADGNGYRIRGFIDRLSRDSESGYEIHDYKTSSYLPSQQDADNDPKLVSFIIIGNANYTQHWYSPKGSMSKEEIIRKMTNILMFGIIHN
jgi:hypothetical protein